MMSDEGNAILAYMLRNLSGCSHIYRDIADGCYGTAVEHHHVAPAPEGKEPVINKFFEIMESFK